MANRSIIKDLSLPPKQRGWVCGGIELEINRLTPPRVRGTTPASGPGQAPNPTPTSAVFATQHLAIINGSLRRGSSLLRRIWLVFAQACTLCLAALFVVSTLRPDLLWRVADKSPPVVLLQETSTPVVTPVVATFSDAAKKAMPSVVGIYTSKEMRQRGPLGDDPILRRYFPDLAERLPKQRATSLGSGVIVSAEGYVLTNNHVIEGADDIQIVLADGRRLGARVRGTDPESDLAVLKADGDNFPAITFGALDRVQVGDFVLAIGNPFGFGNTVTLGIVSALGRNHLGHQPLRGLHPDRRRDQPRQLRRRARGYRGQPDRRQQHDLFPVRGLARHRFRDSGLARAHGAGADHQGRRRDARLAGARAAGRHHGSRPGARARQCFRRADPRHRKERSAERPESWSATSCSKSTASRPATRRRSSRGSRN